MASDLTELAERQGVKFILFNFTDLFGVQRAKLVPVEAASAMQSSGAGFAGFAAWLDMTPADPDMFVMPDPDTFTVLPWRSDVAWVAGDPWMEGEPVDQAPRNVLKRVLERAGKSGFRPMTGVEPEFHLLQSDGSAISDPRDTAEKPCYDQSAMMRRLDVIADISTALNSLGWGVYQNDHEDSNGQFEINWAYADALRTADRHAFFRFAVKSIAEQHGLRATFMPKPFTELTGNGCHVHLSIWDESAETNLFHDEDGEMGLSKRAYQFVGGLLHHAEGLAAITNPTVNSYKRINAASTMSGATWSPSAISFGGNNRTHMVRIPEAGRIEIRLADGAANPYLLQAATLACGLDGIEVGREAGDRLDIDMYGDEGKTAGVPELPLNLLDAIRHFHDNVVICDYLGEAFCTAYGKLRLDEWNRFSRSLTEWERHNTLDC